MARLPLKFNLLPSTVITTAVSITPGPNVANFSTLSYLCAQAKFVYGSGGTSADVYIQTTLDGGATWVDIMNFNFLLATATKVSAVNTSIALAAAVSPTDGTIASNTILNGLLGLRYRVKYKSAGTYAGGTTLQVDVVGCD